MQGICGVTSTWACAECGDGPFKGEDLIGHARAHGHELRFGDFKLQSSTSTRQRPIPVTGEDGALVEEPPLF
jgi:hypothetical protein